MNCNNRKRRLQFGSIVPSHKRRKLSTKERKLLPLYINDRNTTESELRRLPMSDFKSVQAIMQQRIDKPFKSILDVVDCINHGRKRKCNKISKHDIEDNLYFPLIFKTRYEEESDNIYNVLMNIELLADQPTDIIKKIAEMATGNLEECDRTNCDENILFLDYPNRNHYDGSHYIIRDKIHYLHFECASNKQYYYRKNRWNGIIKYCYKCTKQLRKCRNCCGHNYFDHDE